ncbi:hypothetical protein ACEQ8H_002075 [Pleosporales sp. CAS-2024a]
MPGTLEQSYLSSPTRQSDGFTAEEPAIDYHEADLGSLEPGPRNLRLMGRIVNFYNVAKPSKQHKAAQGYLKIQLADNTGVLTVRLWYNNTIYRLRLGQLVTLWTVHVSNSSEHNNLAPSTAPLFTSIFPEGERNCYLMVHENSNHGTQFKRPFNCSDSATLPGLMTLKSFGDGGYEVDEPKLLVYMNRNGTTSELVSLAIFDDTADAELTLYSVLCASALSFTPSQTILLISNPGWRIDKTAKLSINGNSRVDVDPDLSEAHRLRALAQRLSKIEHVNPPFPSVDVSGFETARLRALFTLADIDEVARANPNETILGYLSVIITALDMVTPFKRNMLMCNECCGIPTYANELHVKCQACDKDVALRINPKILGPIVDETGHLSCGNLILSDTAWEQLLGRSPQQLVATNVHVLRYLEQRLLFLRVTMGFALSLDDEPGRLAVWCVKN